jgi:hypothetical protein
MPLPDTPPGIEVPHVAADFDVATGTEPRRSFTVIRPRCAPGQSGEIVVCASDPQQNRLTALPNTPLEAIPKAEARLSENATMDLHGETATVSGVPSNRAMVRLKIGF